MSFITFSLSVTFLLFITKLVVLFLSNIINSFAIYAIINSTIKVIIVKTMYIHNNKMNKQI